MWLPVDQHNPQPQRSEDTPLPGRKLTPGDDSVAQSRQAHASLETGSAGFVGPHAQRLNAGANSRAAHNAVAAENHAARAACHPQAGGVLNSVQHLDAKFMHEVINSLEGGKAAILRPHRRRALLAGAVDAGLRPFHAHLLMAQAQEAVRHGEPYEPRATDLSPPTTSTTLSKHSHEHSRKHGNLLAGAILVVVLAGAILFGLVMLTLHSDATH